jgi:hypothetical protein
VEGAGALYVPGGLFPDRAALVAAPTRRAAAPAPPRWRAKRSSCACEPRAAHPAQFDPGLFGDPRRRALRPLGAPQYKEYAQIIQGSGPQAPEAGQPGAGDRPAESRTQPLDRGAEPLEGALDDVVGGLQNERGVTVRIIGRGRLPNVLADPWGCEPYLPTWCRTRWPSRRTAARSRARDRQENVVEIAIEDDGEGVDPAELPRLLKPFEQGENALVRRAGGAGLACRSANSPADRWAAG